MTYYRTAEPVGTCTCRRCTHTGPEPEPTRGGPVPLGVAIDDLKALLEQRMAEQ